VSRRSDNRGFTLVEVLVATAVVALGLVGALTAFTMAGRVSGSSRNDTIIPLLAEQKLSELKALPRDELVAGQESGDFGQDYPGFSYEVTVSEPDDSNVVRVELVIHAREMGHAREVAYATDLF